MNAMDEFVLNYTLQRLDKKIDGNKMLTDQFATDLITITDTLDQRTSSLENDQQSSGGAISTLKTLVESLQTELKEAMSELNKTKLNNIKQEMFIRTFHNLQQYEAHDMHVDTFTDDTAIDWPASIRGEWLKDMKAIGKTNQSTVKLKQESVPSFLLISANGTSDEAVAQSFSIDKNQPMDKVSLYIEPHHQDTWQPIEIRITDSKGGAALASSIVSVGDVQGGWINVDLPDFSVEALKEYFIEIHTADIYGYRVGMDTKDTYLAGTSYNLFGSAWTDNNHDIGFKIWCFPTADENDAVIYTNIKTYPTTPVSIIFDKEDVLIDGIINYYISRDGGANWKILQPGIETSLDDLPPGKDIMLKVHIIGGSYINAWGYVIKRGES